MMNSLKKITAIVICFLVFEVGISSIIGEQAQSTDDVCFDLPPGLVNLSLVGGVQDYFIVTLSNVPLGYEVNNIDYAGWCVDDQSPITANTEYNVALWCTYDPSIPWADDEWDMVNYVLNHKVAGASRLDIQEAIWYFVNGSGTGMKPVKPADPQALAMVNDALANGDGWIPSIGEKIAIFCDPIQPVQKVIIEVELIDLLNPDIRITKSTDQSTVIPGSNLMYSIVVENTGDCVLDPVTVVDTLPAGMSYVDDDSGGIEGPTGTITWNLAPLPVGGSITIHLTAHVDTVVSATATEDDETVSVHSALPNGLADIEVEKTVRLKGTSDWTEYVLADAGDTVEFNVSIHNPYSNYTIHWSGDIMDTFPCNLDYVNGSMDDFPLHEQHNGEEIVDWQNKTVLWHPANDQIVPPGGYLNFTYEAEVTCDCGTMIEYNNLTISPDYIGNDDEVIVNSDRGNPGGIPLNFSDSAQVGIICDEELPTELNNSVVVTGLSPSDVSVSDSDYEAVTVLSPGVNVDKSANPKSTEEGMDVTFTIKVSNTGDCVLDPVTVVDMLPAGMSYVDDDSGGIEGPAGTITWNIGPLPFGIRTIQMIAQIDTDVSMVLNNTVDVSGSPLIGDPVSDSDYAEVTVSDCVNVVQSVFDKGFPIRHALTGDWAAAQSFVPTIGSLSKIDLYLRRFGVPDFDLIVELRKDAVNGPLLDSMIFSPSQIPNVWSWIEVDFDDKSVISGDDYFMVISQAPSDVTTSFGYEWGFAIGNLYPEGTFWFTRDGGGLWRDLPFRYEFCFKTFG